MIYLTKFKQNEKTSIYYTDCESYIIVKSINVALLGIAFNILNKLGDEVEQW